MTALENVLEQEQLTIEKEPSLLEQAISATKQTDRSQTEMLLSNLTKSALQGTVKWNKNLHRTISDAIACIDTMISRQLSVIMHDANFQTIEGSWRGLHHMVFQSETGAQLKIRMISVKKRELAKDLEKAVEFDQSQLYKKIYEAEYGIAGGQPMGALIGDYAFTNEADDMDMLRNISSVSAAAFCPFISSADPKLFGFDEWANLEKPRDLAKLFDSADYAKWKSFRESEDSRFVVLTMPRVLARMPYGEALKKAEGFHFEEFQDGQTSFCWMNAAYAYATTLTKAFAEHGWCTAIRGAENGGKVENLPLYTFRSESGEIDYQCPTEIGITDRREAELSQLGFLPLCHYKNTDYAVFFGAQTVQKPKQYDQPSATANAAISARMPYIMATSRFAHYLKILARDKIGSFMEASDVQAWLNRWIMQYANSNPQTKASLKAKYPLSEARIEVQEIPGQPGSYKAVAWLRPWLQMEELTTSMRLVADIPKKGA
jgi:type VI secretion system protein ImpC